MSRYIYVPVGGGQNVIIATLLVFTFVALWHDLSMKLLMWGWLVSLFFLPELSARHIFNEKQVKSFQSGLRLKSLTYASLCQYGNYWWYRHLCAVGAVGNILMLMTANLVGFAIGVDGIKYLLSQLTGSLQGLIHRFLGGMVTYLLTSGLSFLLTACVCLFIAAQVMFEYR
jgi:protein-cysteine N-palmitoyltransferase HHAT